MKVCKVGMHVQSVHTLDIPLEILLLMFSNEDIQIISNSVLSYSCSTTSPAWRTSTMEYKTEFNSAYFPTMGTNLSDPLSK